MNTKNLILLANYLEALPSNWQHFTMSEFMVVESNDVEPYDAKDTVSCGTSACAIGHAVFVEGLPKPKGDVDWVTYGKQLFDIHCSHPAWSWCFSSSWACVDDTPKGAAARIKHLIEVGKDSLEWDGFSYAKEVLKAVNCYRSDITHL